MKPGLKTVLEGHRGHIEVVSQALKTEVANFFHTPNVGILMRICSVKAVLTYKKSALIMYL